MGHVSIVLATYNGAAYLEEQLDSILKNTYKDWTVEICDDGSTDGTLEIVASYQKQYPGKFQLYKNEVNRGVTVNFLEGAKRAKGEYIMFCDQDDVWMENKIETTLAGMQAKEKEFGKDTPIVVFTDAQLVDATLQSMDATFFSYNGLHTQKTDLAHLLMENKVIGCTTMFNRALQQKLVCFPLHARYHDWWIALIGAAFGKVCYLDEITILYRQHGNNVEGAKGFWEYVWDRMKDLKAQKKALIANERQAREFYEIYKKELLDKEQEIVQNFANIRNINWFRRVQKLFYYGFWKSGKIRNIGVLLTI
ncbi:MAG: glycosyltransferase family 2 protein [Lachnospiraceae bacterium]|nr:glycosyltransferase family 2 protein [Lachnospiraceae bacterium]